MAVKNGRHVSSSALIHVPNPGRNHLKAAGVDRIDALVGRAFGILGIFALYGIVPLALGVFLVGFGIQRLGKAQWSQYCDWIGKPVVGAPASRSSAG